MAQRLNSFGESRGLQNLHPFPRFVDTSGHSLESDTLYGHAFIDPRPIFDIVSAEVSGSSVSLDLSLEISRTLIVSPELRSKFTA